MGGYVAQSSQGGYPGDITGSGTANTIAMFTSAQVIGNSIITQSGSTITVAGSLTANTQVNTPILNGVSGNLAHTNNVQTTGAVTNYTWTATSNTGQTASTAIPQFLYTSGNTQWATGALAATQPFYKITQPTISFIGSSTATLTATFYIAGAPNSGANAIQTTTCGLYVDTAAVNGTGTAGTSYGAYFNAMTGASSNYSVGISGGLGLLLSDVNVVLGTTTGTKFGTSTSQKLSFYNSTPIVQPTGDVTTALQNLGLGASLTVSANTIQSVNEATDTTCFPLFISASGTQTLQPLNNAGFIYNSNTNALTATTFLGNLTGATVTGSGSTTTGLTVSNSVTASGAVARGTLHSPTLIAAANNDILTGIQINPTFTLAAFTGTNSFGLGITCGTAQIRMGCLTGSTSTPAIYLGSATPSTSNYFVNDTGTNCSVNAINAAGNLMLKVGGSAAIINIGGVSAGSNGVTFTALTQTAQTASANIQQWKFVGASKQFASGAQPLQYFTWFTTNTLAYNGSATCTYSSSMAVEYISRGSNATLTTTSAISILTGAFTNTTTAIGLDIQLATGATNSYGIRIDGGTTTSAPILLTSGTNMTTAVAGAFEYDGTNLFFTRTGTTRESVICSNAVNAVNPTAQNRTITVIIAGTTYYLTAKTTND